MDLSSIEKHLTKGKPSPLLCTLEGKLAWTEKQFAAFTRAEKEFYRQARIALANDLDPKFNPLIEPKRKEEIMDIAAMNLSATQAEREDPIEYITITGEEGDLDYKDRYAPQEEGLNLRTPPHSTFYAELKKR